MEFSSCKIRILSLYIYYLCLNNEIITKCWELTRKLQILKSRRPTRKWPSSGTLTKIQTTGMRQSRNFEKYLKLTKTFLILKNAKSTTPTDFKARKHLPFIISIPLTQKIFSRNSLATMSSTTSPSSVVSSEKNKATEAKQVDCSEVSVLLDLGKACSIMMTFLLVEGGSKAGFLVVASVVEVSVQEHRNR